jgi:phosphoribosyl 1,2-cyclic phosphodiesterase
MIRYAVLGSGSNGNSYIINYKESSILIDAGFSLRQLKVRVEAAHIDFSTIKALFITHLHPDHARGAGVFARQTQLPVYFHNCINDTIKEFASLRIPPVLTQFFQVKTPVKVGDFTITSFHTRHDSPYSVGFVIEIQQKRFLFLTDTGLVESDMISEAHLCDVLFVEANYDENMLLQGPYPYQLKKRISGPFGHLSNSDAISMLNTITPASPQRVYFCHLSNTNNRVDLLESYIKKELTWRGEHTVCNNGDTYFSYLKIKEEVL